MHDPMKKKALAAMCTLICTGGLCTAAAQDGPDETASRADPVLLDRVVSTAQKRVESVLEVPLGITVIGEEQLESIGSGRLTDFAAYVPGFQVDSGGAPGMTSMSLRGVAPLGGGAIIGTYIDDTPIGNSSLRQRANSYSLDLLPYDIESVEVLRGPQGTLYGASAMSGLLKYTTKSADPDHFEFRVGTEVSHVGDSDSLGTAYRTSFNVPLIEGRLAMRASLAHNGNPGFVDEPILGKQDMDNYHQLGSRLAFTWRITDNVDFRLQGLWQTTDAETASQVALDPVTLAPVAGPLDGNAALAQPYRSEIDYYSAILDWDLQWADFVSASSHSDTRTNFVQDASLTYGVAWPLFGYGTGLSDFDLYIGNRKWTQEFRLTSKESDRFEWLVGVFLTGETHVNRQLVRAFDAAGQFLPIHPAGTAALPGTYEEQAVFADVTWKIGPRFDISGGLRFARNDQAFTQITSGPLLGTSDVPGASDESVTTWKLSSRWHFSDATMAYARLATGYRPGSANLALPGVPPTIGSDTLRNLEVGLKSELWGGRAAIDLAWFSIDWTDLQVGAITGTGLTYTANAGSAESEGVELSFLARPADGLTLGLNAAYIDTEIGQDVPATSGLIPGDRMPLTPEFSWSATADYRFDLAGSWGARLGGGYRYTGDRIGLLGFPIESYKALDLYAEVSNDTWAVRLFARNATDERAYMSMSPQRNALTGELSSVRGVPLQPRTIGLAVDYRYW